MAIKIRFTTIIARSGFYVPSTVLWLFWARFTESRIWQIVSLIATPITIRYLWNWRDHQAMSHFGPKACGKRQWIQTVSERLFGSQIAFNGRCVHGEQAAADEFQPNETLQTTPQILLPDPVTHNRTNINFARQKNHLENSPTLYNVHIKCSIIVLCSILTSSPGLQ